MCEPIQYKTPPGEKKLGSLQKGIAKILRDGVGPSGKSLVVLRALLREAVLHNIPETADFATAIEPLFLASVSTVAATKDAAAVLGALRFVPTRFPVWQKAIALCASVGLDEAIARRSSDEYYTPRPPKAARFHPCGYGAWIA